MYESSSKSPRNFSVVDLRADLTATVYICAHYIPNRIQYLALVLAGIESWPMARVDVVIVSNDVAIGEENAIAAAREIFATRGWKLRVEVAFGLDHPFHLTWWHKRYIPNWLNKAVPARDYFVYIEDDIVIDGDNISYFVDSLQRLAPHGLIPSFLRYEIDVNGDRRSVDLVSRQALGECNSRSIEDRFYVVPQNPYWAGFILDRALAHEYILSASFDIIQSEHISNWDVRARAAMGLTWEHIPSGLRSRYVIPLNTGKPSPGCQIWHCANNYSNMRDTLFCRLSIDHVFLADNLLWRMRRKLIPNNFLWHLQHGFKRGLRYLMRKAAVKVFT